jgi:hypothetical protein
VGKLRTVGVKEGRGEEHKEKEEEKEKNGWEKGKWIQGELSKLKF